MKQTKQLKPLYQRDRLFHFFSLMLLVMPLIYYGTNTVMEIIRFRSGTTYGTFNPLDQFESIFQKSFSFWLVLQLMKWGYFEGEKNAAANLALPLSRKDRVKYDLQICHRALLLTAPIYTMFLIIFQFAELRWYQMGWISRNRITELSVFVREYFFPRLLFYLLFVFTTALSLAALYTLCVLGKSVSRSIGGALFFVCSVLYVIFLFKTGVVDVLRANRPVEINTQSYMYEIKEQLTMLLFLVPAVVMLRLLIRLSIHKADETKGGEYYFKSVRYFVVTVAAIIGFLAMYVLPEGLFWLRLLAAIAFSAAVFAGMTYLTRAK
ncbi:MAG: hypothetical protein KIG94_06635 [Acetatifactor sp.]|nr:hypothetical protein [Acetatifactor sp.]